ncbi:MAG: MBL fold metallo-hydrolase [Gammaproteobacteria bacterium]|nr:MBL fold metallo-hydrolase [Gammaproteobacteria bacterium]
MNQITVVVFLLFASLPIFADVIPDYPAEKIAANTYVIHGPVGFPSPENKGFMNNPVFTVTKTGVVVIDPGSSLYSGQMVLRQIRKISDMPVTHVLSTHVHGDHWLGNHALKDAFPEAVFIGHPEMIAQAKAGAAESWIKRMSTATKGATDGTKAVIPDKALDDADSFTSGGMTFRILAPKQAHSGTDIMILIREDKVLVTGDNILNSRVGRMDDATFRGNINACDVALKSGATVFVPGHGPTGDSSVITSFRTYLSIIYDTAAVLIEDGLSAFEMKPKIVEKLQAYQTWKDFDDQIGKQISLAMLEAEKAMFE